jgi:OmpA-OmpF porin, OOP family
MAGMTVAGLVGACSGEAADPPAPDATPSSSASPSSTAVVATVAGYPVGQFPPIPLITVPDVTALTQSQATVSDDLQQRLGRIPGLEVTAARCDAAGLVVNSAGTVVLYGDGSGTVTDDDGSIVNYGDGSGVSVTGDATIVNYGDGAGTYTDDTTTITVYGDGSGTYTKSDGMQETTVTIYTGGAGTYTDGFTTNTNHGDGSGGWTDAEQSITNYGDGSGSYVSATVTIQNYGDGTGLVNGLPVEIDPLPPLGRVGSFPDVEALAPVGNVCGTLVRLPGDVLFDFDSDEVRADAAPALQVVADALAGATGAVQVDGHTDGFGEDAYNQDLSERRADSVVTWLQDAGVSTPLVPTGYGETRPIAPETVDGHDDPAGRQLNRRVEFVIPGT